MVNTFSGWVMQGLTLYRLSSLWPKKKSKKERKCYSTKYFFFLKISFNTVETYNEHVEIMSLGRVNTCFEQDSVAGQRVAHKMNWIISTELCIGTSINLPLEYLTKRLYYIMFCNLHGCIVLECYVRLPHLGVKILYHTFSCITEADQFFFLISKKSYFICRKDLEVY